MSFSPYTEVSSVSGHGLSSGPGQTRAKRNRVQLSCTHCRASKLKCDRRAPCSQCSQRGRASQCIIPTPVARKRPAVSMQNRLRHLESLVKDVMTGKPPTDSTGTSTAISNNGSNGSPLDVPKTIPTCGHGDTGMCPGCIFQNTKETAYLGATHWAAILDHVSS